MLGGRGLQAGAGEESDDGATHRDDRALEISARTWQQICMSQDVRVGDLILLAKLSLSAPKSSVPTSQALNPHQQTRSAILTFKQETVKEILCVVPRLGGHQAAQLLDRGSSTDFPQAQVRFRAVYCGVLGYVCLAAFAF